MKLVLFTNVYAVIRKILRRNNLIDTLLRPVCVLSYNRKGSIKKNTIVQKNRAWTFWCGKIRLIRRISCVQFSARPNRDNKSLRLGTSIISMILFTKPLSSVFFPSCTILFNFRGNKTICVTIFYQTLAKHHTRRLEINYIKL